MADEIIGSIVRIMRNGGAAYISKELRRTPSASRRIRMGYYNLFEYEKKFLHKVVSNPNGPSVIQKIIDAACIVIQQNANKYFTAENLLAHTRLQKRELLNQYYSIFIIDKIRNLLFLKINEVIQDSKFSGSRGVFSASTTILTDLILEIYRDAYLEVADQLERSLTTRAVLNEDIKEISTDGIQFDIKDGLFGYVKPDTPSESRGVFEELEANIRELRFSLDPLQNVHPRLHRAVCKYQEELKKGEPDLVRLFLFGGDVQTYLARRQDEIRNGRIFEESAKIEGDFLDTLDEFIIRHTILVNFSSELNETVRNYESIRGLSRKDAENDQVSNPFVNTTKEIAASEELFDPSTRNLASIIQEDTSKNQLDAPKEAAAAQLVRGSLAAFARFTKESTINTVKKEIEETIEENINSLQIKERINRFLVSRKMDIAEIIARYPDLYAWAESVLRHYLG